MTRHGAELTTAGVLCALALVIMWYGAQLPIGWVEGEGPGGGMFPFYMGLLILIGAGVTGIRAAMTPPESRAEDARRPFIDPEARGAVLSVAALLFLAILATKWLGMYISVPAMLLIYLRWIGGHSWFLSLAISLTTPVVMFCFFEWALRIILPKGITEGFFQHIYALIF